MNLIITRITMITYKETQNDIVKIIHLNLFILTML